MNINRCGIPRGIRTRDRLADRVVGKLFYLKMLALSAVRKLDGQSYQRGCERGRFAARKRMKSRVF